MRLTYHFFSLQRLSIVLSLKRCSEGKRYARGRTIYALQSIYYWHHAKGNEFHILCCIFCKSLQFYFFMFSYIDDAIVKLLKSAEKRYSAAYDNPTLYKCPVFNQSRLIDVAGIVEHEHFFTQSLSRRTVAYMWSMVCLKSFRFDSTVTFENAFL